MYLNIEDFSEHRTNKLYNGTRTIYNLVIYQGPTS